MNAVTPDVMSNDAALAVQQISAPALVDPAAVAAAEEAKALVQAAYTMAMHRPRNYLQARQRILDACKRPAFAATVEYAKPVGGSTVRGPSIRFAELAVQQWGNIRVDTSTTFENDEFRKIRIQVLDLETNSCFGKVITVNKTVERSRGEGREVLRTRTNTNGKAVYIVRATEDELSTKEAAAISKVVRNEGLRLIPQDIIDEALEVAAATRRGATSDPQERVRKVCDAFSALRINPEDLSQYLGCQIEKASPAQIDDLQTVYTAIKSGESKWSDYVQRDEDNTSTATNTTAENLKGKLAGAKTQQQETNPATPVQVLRCAKLDREVPITECQGGCPDKDACTVYREETA